MNSFRLLLQNESRLLRREMNVVRHAWIWAVFLLMIMAIVVVLLWVGFVSLRVATAETDLLATKVVHWSAVALWVVSLLFTFVLAVPESVAFLFERGDLDLLLSSPVSGRVVFSVQLIKLTLQLFSGFLKCWCLSVSLLCWLVFRRY